MNELKEILYVDDDADVRSVVSLTLELNGGFNVQACSNGVDALNAMAANPPHLILLDVMMPGLYGIATLAALRRHPQLDKVPVVFVTARLTEYEVDFYKSMGAVGVIAKPFNPMTLCSLLLGIWQRCQDNIANAPPGQLERLTVRDRWFGTHQ